MDSLNVLIGPNAVGKTNLIEVLGLLQAAPNSSLVTAILRVAEYGSGFGWRSGCVAGYLANRYHRVRTESKTRSAAWRVVIQIKFH